MPPVMPPVAGVSHLIIDAAKPLNQDIKLLGLSATPGRGDGRSLRRTFSNVGYHLKIGTLIGRGLLVPPCTFRPEVTRELVEAWYRDRAHIKFPERIELCLGLFPDPDAFRPKGLIVRQTRQRWDPCHRPDACC